MLRPFLSYQWKDKSLVRRIAEELCKYGMHPILDVWEFKPGDLLAESMEEGVKAASAFVLFWSKNSAVSDNVKYERKISSDEKRKRGAFRVIYVRLDDTRLPTKDSGRLYFDWRRGKRRSKLFDQKVQQLASAIAGQPPEKPPETATHPLHSGDLGELRFIYASDFATLKSAKTVVGDRLDSGPNHSPAGPFFTAWVSPDTEAALKRLESVWVYRKSRHKVETPGRKYIYVVQTEDVDKLEEIIGSIEDFPLWETTRLGLHIEADLVSDQVAQVELLPSVKVFDEPQHTLSYEDRRVHEKMRWSKRVSNAVGSNIRFKSVEEFAAAFVTEFQNICLVDLTLSNVEVTVRDRSYTLHLTMSHDKNATPQQGSGTANLNNIMEGMKVFVVTDRGVKAEQIEFEMRPIMCTDGVIVTIEYMW